jgi:Fe2+ transport system protein FeoA
MFNMKLSDLRRGESGIIRGYADEELHLKLMEMGFIIGEKINVVETGFFEDPMAFKVCGYIVSLRKTEAAAVEIDKITD